MVGRFIRGGIDNSLCRYNYKAGIEGERRSETVQQSLWHGTAVKSEKGANLGLDFMARISKLGAIEDYNSWHEG